MIKYLLCAIVVLSCITLYLEYKKESSRTFRHIVSFFLLVVVFNATYIFVGELLLFNASYFELLPFGFIYGAILYYAFCTINGNKLSKQKKLLHLVPFLLVVTIYIINLSTTLFNNAAIRSVHYLAMILSMSSYSLNVMLSNSSNHNKNFKEEYGLLNLLSLLLIAVSVMIFVLAGSLLVDAKAFNNKVPLILIYSVLLISVFLVFRYTINSFLSFQEIEPHHDLEKSVEPSYKKSALPADVLDSYEQKLYVSMIKQMVFLDEELSLQSLARQLKIPKHHLTQLLSVRIGENFYHYINRFRVDYACKLINQSVVDLTLEELAYKSGFNSKTSFNRYFKKQVGCTPSEYRNL